MILVLGVGRSGTSEVARILQELGVDMGQGQQGDEFNPLGYYEDKEFQAKNMAYFMMGLHEKQSEYPLKLWRTEFDKLIATKTEPWGVKDPGIVDMAFLLEEYAKLNPKIVLCSREKEDTIGSLMRMKGITREKAEEIYYKRMENLSTFLKDKDYLEIDCYDEHKEDKLKALIK